MYLKAKKAKLIIVIRSLRFILKRSFKERSLKPFFWIRPTDYASFTGLTSYGGKGSLRWGNK